MGLGYVVMGPLKTLDDVGIPFHIPFNLAAPGKSRNKDYTQWLTNTTLIPTSIGLEWFRLSVFSSLGRWLQEQNPTDAGQHAQVESFADKSTMSGCFKSPFFVAYKKEKTNPPMEFRE